MKSAGATSGAGPAMAGFAWLAILALGLACAVPVRAGDVPEVQRYGGVEYVTGALGIEELAEVGSHQFNLGLTFSARGGDFVGSVRVLATNRKGATVLDVTTEGPRLLARLPPGRYRVAATFGRRTLNKDVTLAGKGTLEVEFVWPVADSLARRVP